MQERVRQVNCCSGMRWRLSWARRSAGMDGSVADPTELVAHDGRNRRTRRSRVVDDVLDCVAFRHRSRDLLIPRSPRAVAAHAHELVLVALDQEPGWRQPWCYLFSSHLHVRTSASLVSIRSCSCPTQECCYQTPACARVPAFLLPCQEAICR